MRDDDKRDRERWESHWPGYRAAGRRDAFVRSKALGRAINVDEDPAKLTPEDLAKLDAHIRKEFDQAGAARIRASFEDRWRRFSRVMPARALDVALDPIDTAALRALRAWEESSTTEIAVLLGPPGCGKTVAAVTWAWESLSGQAPPRFVTGGELARSSKFDAERNRLLDAPSLILDDLGAANDPSDVDEIVDRYYGDQGRLVITTNLSADGFATRYGDRVTDRLREAGLMIALGGPSLRRKGS